MMLEGAGFEVIDLGVDVPPEKIHPGCKRTSPRPSGLFGIIDYYDVAHERPDPRAR